MIKKDICIIGGGLVGGVMAIDLAQRGFHVIVIDRDSPQTMLDPVADGRTTAVNLLSKRYFEELGIWDGLDDHAEQINDIKVYEGGSPWSIHFDHRDIGSDPMGYIVDNKFIRQAIIKRALKCPTLQWIAPCHVLAKKITQQKAIIYTGEGAIQDKNSEEISYEKYEEIYCQLVISAEGRQSKTRHDVGIKAYEFPYHQKALVFSVFHEKYHHQMAWEVFYPQGPLAFLPAKSTQENIYRSGVVWTLSPQEADYWASQSHEDLAEKLEELFPHLGKLTLGTQLWNYPLTAQMVDRFIDERLVIVGDAAHVCHPVAGQGVNVGWRDAKELGNVLGEARSVGSDLGSSIVLLRYQRARRIDTYSIFAMTDGMIRLFSNRSPILGFLRTGGLGVVNQLSPLKRFFMRRAMGV